MLGIKSIKYSEIRFIYLISLQLVLYTSVLHLWGKHFIKLLVKKIELNIINFGQLTFKDRKNKIKLFVNIVNLEEILLIRA